MPSELFLYDRDAGLFKQILKKSTVIQGRYFILTTGNEINSSNLGQYISDALNGMQAVQQKYPICLCMPPRSFPDKTEQFVFTMFFLTRSGLTGQNKIKAIDDETQASTHHTWYDWKDMSECARNFLGMLNKVLRLPGAKHAALSYDGTELTRLSNIGNDNISGVRLQFRIDMGIDCDLNDYPEGSIDDITIPSLNIHPLHKH